MDSIRTLTVNDISERLSVHPETVKRWIKSGVLKGNKECRRLGYKVKINDFEEFLNSHPTYRSIDEKDIPYEKAKSDILKDLMIGLYELQKGFLCEDHGKVYTQAWNDAMEKFSQLIKKSIVDTY